jgi:hypothetical protein
LGGSQNQDVELRVGHTGAGYSKSG